MKCGYCGREAQLLRLGDAGYPYWTSYGPVHACLPCGARVGCHPGSTQPLGTLANAELRRARYKAHDSFDALWRRKIRVTRCSQKEARNAGYAWLSKQMGLPPEQTHIAMMNITQCATVVELCAPHLPPNGDKA